MDTIKDSRIPPYGIPEGRPSGKIVVGSKQLKKALSKGLATMVYLARDADPAITGPIEALCREANVPYVWLPTMAELGSACGIDVGASAAAAVNHP